MFVGNQIELRLVSETDLDMLHREMSDLANRGNHFPLGVQSESALRAEHARTGFWQSDEGMLLIENTAGKVVGEIEFYPIIHYLQGYELSYLIFGQANRGHGYATEAVRVLAGFLFGEKRVDRIQLRVHPANESSKRVAAKCGFSFEGVMRSCWFHRGEFHDLEMWSILRGEATDLPLQPAEKHVVYEPRG